MPPKKKSKATKKQIKPQIKTKWDDLDVENLEQEIANLQSQHETSLQERIRVQTEHDAVRSYYNVTQQEIEALEDEMKLKHYEVEREKEDNLEEKQIYKEKIKQLDYNFERKLQMAEESKQDHLKKEEKEYEDQLISGEDNILGARDEVRERQVVYIEEIRQQKLRLTARLLDIEKKLECEMKELQNKCLSHHVDIEEELDLKRMVELRDMEEQLNFHIFEMERNHRELYDSTKTRYTNTSSENSAKIKKLQDECQMTSDAIRKFEDRAKLLLDENDRLSRPLGELTSKANLIKTQIKCKDKNRQSLMSIRSRRIVVQDRVKSQKEANDALQNQYDEMRNEHERLQNALKVMAPVPNLGEMNQSDAQDKSVTTSISEAIAQLEAFQTTLQSTRSQISIRNVCSPSGTRREAEDQGSDQLKRMVMDSQRSFNTALWRLKSELKSATLL